jgi:hypothetical protein
LVRALGDLGLFASATRGSAMGSAAMRIKLREMSRRALTVTMSSIGFTWFYVGPAHSLHALWALGALGTVAAGAIGFQTRKSVRPALRAADPASPLPTPIGSAIDRVVEVVPGIVEARHRSALRAVVQRALRMNELLEDDAGIRAELAQAIDVALLAAVRLDELDRSLSAQDLREPDAATRELLLERDRWAARLLDLAASLEGFEVRFHAAKTSTEDAGSTDLLLDLGARISALEEVA